VKQDALARALAGAIEGATGERFEVAGTEPVSGGCIHTALKVSGRSRGAGTYFAKVNAAERAPVFAAECEGLAALRDAGAVTVPGVIACGADETHAWLILEWLELAPLAPPSAARLGTALAAQHAKAQDKFGWAHDNFIGSSVQANGWSDEWLPFWREKRLHAQLRLAARNRLPIVVGGTGLYYRALTAGLFEAPPPDETLRARHRELADRDGIEALRARLIAVDPEAAAGIAPRDFVRISRALEVYEQTGIAITTLRRQAAPPHDLSPTVLLLDPPLGESRARITARVDAMIAAGLLDEVRALHAAGYGPTLRPLQALGYKQLGAVLAGTTSMAEATAETVRATFAYARRQRTWFKKEAAATRFAAVPEIEVALEAVATGAGPDGMSGATA